MHSARKGFLKLGCSSNKATSPQFARKGGVNQGFTLFEALMVCVCLAVLVSVLLPVLVRAQRHASETMDASQMRQLYMAFAMYEESSGAAFAKPQTLGELLPWVSDARLFKSSADFIEGEMPSGGYPARLYIPNAQERSPFRISYAYLGAFEPFDKNAALWQKVRETSGVGLIACQWHGTPVWSDLRLLTKEQQWSLGPRIDGPILRINMDGSLFRLPVRNMSYVVNQRDLFFRR